MTLPVNPGTANLSLVAYYGDKPPEIEALIREAQAILQDSLAGAFRPYDICQVHATLISLEGHRSGDAIVNANYHQFLDEQRAIDFRKVFDLLRAPGYLPLDIVIGGYHLHHDYGFTSRGTPPALRSFSIQGNIAVAMGWPFDGEKFPPVLDELRRAFNSANVLHKYHRTAGDMDNDFYFVLGNVDPGECPESVLQSTRERMIGFFSQRTPLTVPVTREKLRIIAYTDPRVPPESTRCYTIDEGETKLVEIKSLYRLAEGR